MSAARWCDAFDPVQIWVRCGDAVHRVTWRRGKLVLEDHANLTAERSLVALGGPECACMAILAVWSAGLPEHRVVDQLQLIEPPGPAGDDVVTVPSLESFRAHVGAPPRMEPALRRLVDLQQRESHRQLVAHLLPAPLLLRFHLGATIGCARRWDDVPPDLRINPLAVFARCARSAVVASMSSWRRAGASRRRTVDVALVPPSGKREVSGRVDHREARAAVALPLSWMVTVWARGLAVVDGCFVLEAGVPGPDGVDADAVRWERLPSGASEPVVVPARLRLDDGGRWRLRWA